MKHEEEYKESVEMVNVEENFEQFSPHGSEARRPHC